MYARIPPHVRERARCFVYIIEYVGLCINNAHTATALAHTHTRTLENALGSNTATTKALAHMPAYTASAHSAHSRELIGGRGVSGAPCHALSPGRPGLEFLPILTRPHTHSCQINACCCTTQTHVTVCVCQKLMQQFRLIHLCAGICTRRECCAVGRRRPFWPNVCLLYSRVCVWRRMNHNSHKHTHTHAANLHYTARAMRY